MIEFCRRLPLCVRRAPLERGPRPRSAPGSTRRAGLCHPAGHTQAGHTRFRFWPWQREVVSFKHTPSRSLGSCPCPGSFPARGGEAGYPSVPPLPGHPSVPSGGPPAGRGAAGCPRRTAGCPRRTAAPSCGSAAPSPSAEPSARRRAAPWPPPVPGKGRDSCRCRQPARAARQPRPLPAPPPAPLAPAASQGSSRVTGRFSLMPTNSHEATDKRVASGTRAATEAGHGGERGTAGPSQRPARGSAAFARVSVSL